jgi:hypothetical protein
MSIYATLWGLKFPRLGEFHSGCEWVTVLAQAVPAHVGADGPDPYASFLPPLNGSIAKDIRAVVFVTLGAEKGTGRSGQEYVAPLLVLSGTEYAAMPFSVLHGRMCDALRGDQPRVIAEVIRGGESKLVFEDGSSTFVPPSREHED